MKTKILCAILGIAFVIALISFGTVVIKVDNAQAKIADLQSEITHLNNELLRAKNDLDLSRIVIIDLQNQNQTLKNNPIIMEKKVVEKVIEIYPVYIYPQRYDYPRPIRLPPHRR